MARDPSQAFERALALHQAGRLDEAERLYGEILAADPAHARARALRGAIGLARGRPAEALEALDASLAIEAGDPVAHSNRGLALHALGRHAEALAAFERAYGLAPAFADAYRGHGNALLAMGRTDEALASYERALQASPRDPDLLCNRGVILLHLRRHEEALASCDAAIAAAPGHAQAHTNRGIALAAMHRLDEALASHDRAIALQPANAAAHNNRALALIAALRFAEALEAAERAVALQPRFAEALHSRGIALKELRRYPEALDSFDRAAALGARIPYLDGTRLFLRMQLCDWRGIEPLFGRIAAGIEAGQRLAHPFSLLATPASAALQRRCAEIFVADRHPPRAAAPPRAPRDPGRRLRVGYFSADFHEHATAFLAAEVFERHDRARFEVTAFSFGLPSSGAMRRRLEAAFEHFIDVRSASDADIVALARARGIDIAVDLKGFTQDARPSIFAARAAAIQVSFLGYPGTMGAPYVDYLIADEVVVPAGLERHYAERVIRLPHTYQPNDSRRRVAAEPATRREAGLPERGFVFCCFNNTFKIGPEAFSAWMRLLAQVEGSVLWLLGGEPVVVDNLRREAAQRGIDPQRLVFAPPLENARHLARLRFADLFLDTFHCGAHTTASDALWSAVPVVTCPGETFASRVAASLLNAIGMPDLVAGSRQRYEELALELARRPDELAMRRAALARNRATMPLFDAARFTRDLEAAFLAMGSGGD